MDVLFFQQLVEVKLWYHIVRNFLEWQSDVGLLFLNRLGRRVFFQVSDVGSILVWIHPLLAVSLTQLSTHFICTFDEFVLRLSIIRLLIQRFLRLFERPNCFDCEIVESDLWEWKALGVDFCGAYVPSRDFKAKLLVVCIVLHLLEQTYCFIQMSLVQRDAEFVVKVFELLLLLAVDFGINYLFGLQFLLFLQRFGLCSCVLLLLLSLCNRFLLCKFCLFALLFFLGFFFLLLFNLLKLCFLLSKCLLLLESFFLN